MNHNLLRSLGGLTAAASLCLASGSAFAFAPTNQFDGLEIPLNTDHFLYGEDVVSNAASSQTALTLENQTGSAWKVFSWNAVTNTPHLVYGNGLKVAPSLVQDTDVRAAAESVAMLNADAMGLNPADLEFTYVRRGLGKAAAHFQQLYRGIEVHDGRFHATFSDEGHLMVMGSDFYSGIELDVNPALSEDQAFDFATQDLSFDPQYGDRADGDAKLMVLPLVSEDRDVDFRLVYQFRIRMNEGTAIWVTSVDANTGEVVWRYNDVHFLDYTGTTRGDVQDITWCEGEVDLKMQYTDVTVSGAGSATSDIDGVFTIPFGGTGSAAITAQFFGPWCNVNRANGQGSDSVFNGTATAGTPFPLHWTDANSRQDERDVFSSVSDMHDFFESFDPGYAYANFRITANVGVSGQCNAYWNGTINFYNTGGGCHNTGEIEGVVAHEFGHGVQDDMLGNQGNEGLGEGNGDILNNFMVDESAIGRGFQSCANGLRDSDNDRHYPEDLNGSVHNDGQIIAGFTWHMRENIEANLGAEAGKFRSAQLWHFGRLVEVPRNQPDQVLSMFIADDDDGNLMNGTPNHEAICQSADRHGFSCPEILVGVFVNHTPLATPQPAGDAVIDAEVTTTIDGANIVGVELHYSIEGASVVTVAMTNTSGDSYTASIPALADPTCDVSYYLTAEDNLANTGSSPSSAPANMHSFAIPSEFDDMESDSGWTVNAEGSDDASTGQWVRLDPTPTNAQPGDDHTPDGTICWVTGNGGSGGENDVDDGTTTLYTPEYDMSGSTDASVKLYRWYSNTEGADPNNDIWTVQARNNGGSWVNIESNQSNQNQWFLLEADLVALFGAVGVVEFKFIASDLNSGSIVEAAIDDFSLCYTGMDPADVDDIDIHQTARFAFYGSRPNPVEVGSTISFQIPSSNDVELGLYDVNGRAIRTLASGSFNAGLHNVEWDGKDASGNSIASGIYYLRFRAGEYTGNRTLVMK